MISQGARSMTVGRSSFSGRASEHWSASWEIATCRVARVAAAPRLAPVPLGTRRLGFSLQSSAGGDPHGENGRSRGNDGAVSRLTPAAAQVSGANVASRRRGGRRPSWGDRGLRLAADFLAEKFCRARRDALHRRPLLGVEAARFVCRAAPRPRTKFANGPSRGEAPARHRGDPAELWAEPVAIRRIAVLCLG